MVASSVPAVFTGQSGLPSEQKKCLITYMKVLHIIDHFSLGGAQRIVEGILYSFEEAAILPLRKKGAEQDQIHIPAQQKLLQPTGNLLRQMLRLLKAPRVIRPKNFQIVHCHLLYSWLFGLWLYLVLPARQRPKLVFHEHDSVRLVRWYYPLLIHAAHRAGTLVAVSSYIKRQICSHGIPSEDVYLLRNFVDLNRFSPGDRSMAASRLLSQEQAHSYRLIGFAGRLVGYKGWQHFITVSSSMREKNIRFLIAGDGPEAGKLERLIQELDLQDEVILLGYVDHMIDFYRLIDLLIITSAHEAFGLVQLEAQASGVPVILFESEAALELNGVQSSVIVPYGDIKAVIEKIEYLLDNQTAYDLLVQRGLENASHYGLASYQSQLEDLYSRIVQGQNRS
jgi:glycosyltransferase involved in cell wall biosynthesis